MAVEKFIFGHGLKLAEFAHIDFCACCTFFVPCVCMGNSSLNPKMILPGLTVIETYEKEIQSGRMAGFWRVFGKLKTLVTETFAAEHVMFLH